KRLLPLVPLLERSLDGPLPHELFGTVVGDARLFRRFFDVPGVEIDELLLFVGKLRVGRALLPFSTSELVYLSSELTGQGTPHTASPTRGGGEVCRLGSASARHRGRRGSRHRCSACRRDALSGGTADPQPPSLREEKYGSLSN